MKLEIESIGTFNAQKKKESLLNMFCKWYPRINGGFYVSKSIIFCSREATTLPWRLDVAEVLILYNFKKSHEFIGGYCTYFLCATFQGSSRKGILPHVLLSEW
jgi:hypothetical protein